MYDKILLDGMKQHIVVIFDPAADTRRAAYGMTHGYTLEKAIDDWERLG